MAAESDTARLFLALLPPAELRAALTAHTAAWGWPAGARVYAPADWHLTLHFIGAVPRGRLAQVQAGLAVPFSAFSLPVGEPALWPQGLAVLLPRTTPPALLALHEVLGLRLRALDLPTDKRPYRPHLTLARRAAQALPAGPLAWDWAVRAYALMESTSRPGAKYQVLQHYGTAEFVGIGSA